MPRRKAIQPSRRAVGYVRVSSEEQSREGASLEAQTARVQDYARQRGLDLVAIVTDAGVSARISLAKRPGGAEVAAMLETGAASHVIVTKLDRAFRSVVDAVSAVTDWDQRGVSLHLLDLGGETINTRSAVGRMFLTMMAAVGEFERGVIGERVAAVHSHKLAMGKAVSRAPRGARLVRETDGRHSILVPDGAELELYRTACLLRESGLTYRAIAAELTVRGFRPQRKGAGSAMSAATVHYLVRNPNLRRIASDAAA